MLGRKATLDELEDRLPMMGTGWEGKTDEGFEIEVFPNRPDLLSIEGLTRAYASFIGEKIGLRTYTVIKGNYVAVVDPKVQYVRPYFVCAVVKGVDFNNSLIRSIMQLQEKLHMTHGRKRRKVAIGLHNLNVIKFPINYTTEPPCFKFRPLGERFEKDLHWILTEIPKGMEYAWILEGATEYPMIVDAKGMVLSMPPIINGEYTRIDEVTTELFVDITGTDLKAITEVLNIICTTFADRGAKIFSVEVKYQDKTIVTPNLNPKPWKLSNNYACKTLGLKLRPEETCRLLEKMGHGIGGDAKSILTSIPEEKDTIINVKVPCYRTDIMHPMDLVEDVAIAYGYDVIIPEIPAITSKAGEDPLEVFSRGLRNFLIGFGYMEVVTFMMSNHEKLFTKMMLPEEPIAETENPKMEGYTCLRNTLLPSIIEILSFNKHHPYPQNLYEVDDVVLLDPGTETGAKSARRLALVQCYAKANFNEIKATLISLLENLEIKTEIEPAGWDCFIEGRRFTAVIKDQLLCWAGEIRPEVLEAWGLEMPVAALELDVELLQRLVKN